LPISASNLQTQEYQFKVQTPSGLWRWTTRVDLSQATPAYQIRDITTPYGLLRDSIPLPGAVVQEMGNSITLLQQQFAPSILLGLSSLTFVVDEGRGFSLPQDLQITNNGVFGSLLGTVLTTSAPWVTMDPQRVGGLASGSAGVSSVAVDSTTLVSANSPYAATILIQDPSAVNNPQTVSIAIVVRPLAIISLNPTVLNFAVTKPISGPFPGVPTQTFQITNTGPTGSLLDYQIQKLCGCTDWLVSFNPPYNTLAAGASQTTTVMVQPPDTLCSGTYTETLRVSGYSQNYTQDVVVTLVIS
jgi:hypothetical protein